MEKILLALAAIVLIGRIVGLMKWETWILVPALVACSFWVGASPANAATRPAVQCETHGYYNKTTKKTTVTVTTNRPTSKKKFDYRLQRFNSAGDIEAIWVKNQGMKITVKGEFFGGYAYQGVDQCSPYGVGVG